MHADLVTVFDGHGMLFGATVITESLRSGVMPVTVEFIPRSQEVGKCG